MDPTIRVLCDLISIDSINPSLVPGAKGEGEIADAIATMLRNAGLDVEVDEAAPNRPNVVGVLEGRRAGPALMLLGHMDTVGVEGMSAPFDPQVRDGRVFGRGAQDMKGGLAAMIGAAQAVAASKSLQSGRLILAFVVDEEYASCGADHLVKRWRSDAAVVTEPTGLAIATAHKGFGWVEVITHGRAAHGSRPEEGRDAILRMGRVLAELERLDRRLSARPPTPLVGTPSLHASLITGGREWSSYPDRCVVQVERRTVPGEDPRVPLLEIQEILQRLGGEDPEFEAEARWVFGRGAHWVDPSHSLPRMLASACGRDPDHEAYVGMSFWTDAAILAEAGIPAVLFGPDGAGLHSHEEYVVAADVAACRDALVELAERMTASA